MTLAYDDVLAARRRIAGIAHHTPVFTSRTFDELTGAEVFFKMENFQRVGAFKFRGAYNALSRIDADRRARGVIAFSSGNHAQAVALAARILGIKATIVMPFDAPAAKLEATRGYGAEIVQYDRYSQDRRDVGAELAAEHGYTMIPPFDHPDIIAGQGTAVAELIGEVGVLDAVVVPLGGGGLLSGSALSARELSPGARIYGVEPEAGDDGRQSFRAGRIVTIPTPKTIADGAQTTALGELTFPIIRDLVDDVVTASDDELAAQVRFFASRMNVVVEPTGALAAAAASGNQLDLAGQRVGVVVSGGNVDPAALAGILAPA
ncbi:threo-3-hydroxy-L-aspartate ammonia-lyase [Spelaeicoccus albus]|uniref:threonine ammonia-lyase n=1 Tax=Spelaeicoccus albus TaxID=1280376 RepID=A0A7Z0ACA5_9MICO|nr:threo-3-hydroxy-L-aspartate ammonia-lyase [Spelaeicoccus albus]NYI67410.1 threonine dehydratase [Spelaeicoccus albus]